MLFSNQCYYYYSYSVLVFISINLDLTEIDLAPFSFHGCYFNVFYIDIFKNDWIYTRFLAT